MKTNKCLFSFQKVNRYILFPFLVPIICFATKFFSEPMKDNKKEINLSELLPDVEHTFVFLYQMINSLSLFFGGLFYFISCIDNKVRTEKQRKSLLDKEIIPVFGISKDNMGFKKRKKRTIIIVCLMSVIITIYNIIKGYATMHRLLEKRLYFLFFFLLINRILYKNNIYSHQKLSIGIVFIGMALIFAMFFAYMDFDQYDYIYDILLLIGSLFYSLYLVLVKDLTVYNSMSPFFLFFLIGIASTVLTLIGYIIFSLSKTSDITYISNIFNCSDLNYVCFGNFVGYILAYLFLNIILQVLIFLVVYFFSPEVFAICDIISPFMSFISNLIQYPSSNPVSFYIFTGCGYIIAIFGAFLYNEIIVCNCFGLSDNTKINLKNKAIEGERFDSGLVNNDIALSAANLEDDAKVY